jgi:hypothetical protein
MEENTTVHKTLILNGRRITEQELNEEKNRIQSLPGMQLVEISPGVYKTRLLD